MQTLETTHSEIDIVAIIKSRRTFDNTFRLFVANLSKAEEYQEITDFTTIEVTPDVGYERQYEVHHIFTNLLVGDNILAMKIVGEDEVERISYYLVKRIYPFVEYPDVPAYPGSYFPSVPSSPVPADGATNLSRSVQLSWVGGCWQGFPVTYRLFFGKSVHPPQIVNQQVATIYPLSGSMTLDAGESYAWKIVGVDGYGSTEGPAWWFRVAHAPSVPHSPSPWHTEPEVDYSSVNLVWSSESEEGNPLVYDVYFGAAVTPPLVASSYPLNTYNVVGSLIPNGTFYWKIIVHDNKGNSVTSPKWKFKTRS